MNWFAFGRIELAVRNTAACGHSLHIAGSNHRPIAHAVAMFERPRQNVRDDFHVAVRMRGKTFSGRNAIFIDDTQSAKVHVCRIVILIERESVIRVEPTKIEMATIF